MGTTKGDVKRSLANQTKLSSRLDCENTWSLGDRLAAYAALRLAQAISKLHLRRTQINILFLPIYKTYCMPVCFSINLQLGTWPGLNRYVYIHYCSDIEHPYQNRTRAYAYGSEIRRLSLLTGEPR